MAKEVVEHSFWIISSVNVDFLVEWGLGLYLINRPVPIVFAPNVSLRHETTEFNYTVRTNSWGFRGYEISRKREEVYRIITIGDSFTYGWGVDLEHTWPKVLERNLGNPGATTDRYVDIAMSAISLLEPDLVLVAILQNDDLAQLRGRSTDRPQNRGTILGGFFPNVARFFQEKRLVSLPPPHNIENRWKGMAQEYSNRLTTAQRQKYEALDDTVKQMFLSGNLNPALIHGAIAQPTYYTFSLDSTDHETQAAIEAMSKHIGAIDRYARAHNAKVLVLSIPDGGYVNVTAFEGYRRLGYEMHDNFLRTSAMDDATEEACSRAGVEFVKITEHMRKMSHLDTLFYEFDGHPTQEGYLLMARAFASILLEKKYLFVKSGMPRKEG